jgi:hypothetical protein
MDLKSESSRESCWISAPARAAAVLFLAGWVTPAFMMAAGLNGNLSLTDTGIGTIAVNGTDIDFDFSGTVSSTSPPVATSGTVDGTGDSALFTVSSASTLDFFGIIGDTVTVHDLNSADEPVGTTAGPHLPLLNFITFSPERPWSIALTEILPGVEGTGGCNSSGVNCTPAGSPFNLVNEGGGNIAVSFAFLGTASDGLGDTSYLVGTFQTTLSGINVAGHPLNIGDILGALNAGETIVSSATATINVSSVPEPASFSLILLGAFLLSIPAIYRRHHQRP